MVRAADREVLTQVRCQDFRRACPQFAVLPFLCNRMGLCRRMRCDRGSVRFLVSYLDGPSSFLVNIGKIKKTH